MKNWTQRFLLILLALSAAPNFAAAQVDLAPSAADIARDLRSGDRSRIAMALSHIPLSFDESADLGWVFPEGYTVAPEVSSGLIAALTREVDLHLDGATVVGVGGRHPELVLDLLHFVVALRDPASVAALLGMLGTGGLVRDALLSFGPAVIDDLSDIAMSPAAHADHVRGALLGLRDAAIRFDSQISPAARETMRMAAKKNLDGIPGRFGSVLARRSALVGAIRLADLLPGDDITARLARIADRTDDRDTAWIPDDVRQMATEALRRRQ